MSRRKARELAMQCLYQQDLVGKILEASDTDFWQGRPVDEETRAFADLLIVGYRNDPTRIDGLIADHLKNWNLHRMAFVDRNILRMAVAELIARQTPAPVVIDEAIEIAKKFGDNDSREFINAVLDAIHKHLAQGRQQEEA